MRKNNLKFKPDFDLICGNNNYASKIDGHLLETLSEKGQKPKAIIVSCSDSRVPVEVIFDSLEPGKLFVIRVAGNVVSGPIVIGSIEFAIQHLNTRHIVLLGHTGCGAVGARLAGVFGSKKIAQLCSQIMCTSKDLNQAIVENLKYQFDKMLGIKCVQKGIANNSLQAYAMIYNLQTGKVDVLRAIVGTGGPFCHYK